MRKKIAVFVSLLTVLGLLTACGSNGKTGETENSVASTGEQTEAEDTETETKTLTAAANIDYAPFEYYEDGVAVGFDVDLWNEICDYLGYEAEFVHYPWDGLISGIQAEKFDAIVADMGITEERKESVLFTEPYFYETTGICTTEDSDISSVEDLDGQVVGIQTGTTGETWAKEHMEELGIAELVTYETMADAIMDLKVGRTVAVINNGPYMQYQAKIDDEIRMVAIIDDEPIVCGIAFNKEDTELCEEVNEALKALIADGTYAELYEKWFGAEPSEDFMPTE